MRVGLNLAVPASRREQYALAWALPATLLGLAVLVFLVRTTWGQFQDYRRVRASLSAQEAREDSLRDQEMKLRKELEQPQYRVTLNQVRFLNALIEKKQVSLTEMAAEITRMLPDNVRINGLSLQEKGHKLGVRILLTGKDEKGIEAFLSGLEDSPNFRDVELINQGFEETGPGTGPVNVACTAQYVASRP
jgi:hypothetical protein